jgi:hypothetical protein
MEKSNIFCGLDKTRPEMWWPIIMAELREYQDWGKARALIYFIILSAAYKHYTRNKNTSIFQPQKPHILNIWLVQDCPATKSKYLLQSGLSPAHACLLKLEEGANKTPETSFLDYETMGNAQKPSNPTRNTNP